MNASQSGLEAELKVDAERNVATAFCSDGDLVVTLEKKGTGKDNMSASLSVCVPVSVARSLSISLSISLYLSLCFSTSLGLTLLSHPGTSGGRDGAAKVVEGRLKLKGVSGQRHAMPRDGSGAGHLPSGPSGISFASTLHRSS